MGYPVFCNRKECMDKKTRIVLTYFYIKYLIKIIKMNNSYSFRNF